MYSKIMQLRYIGGAAQAIFDARATLRKQGKFMPDKLEDAFEVVLKGWSEVQIERQMEFSYGRDRETRNKTLEFLETGQREFDGIKHMVRARNSVAPGSKDG